MPMSRAKCNPFCMTISPMKTPILSSALALFVFPTLSHAGSTVIITNQGSFLTNLNASPYVESFDALSLQPASPISFSAAGFSYQASTDNGFYNAGQASPGDVWLSVNTATDSIVFNFTSGNVYGVGGSFFTSNVAGAAVAGAITVTINDTTTSTVASSNTGTFIGFVSDVPITSLTVTAGQTGGTFFWPTVNNFIVGSQPTAVPEASSLGIVAFACVGGALVRRRRKL
jgi:hypothetical protein